MKVSTYLYDKNTAFVILKALLGEKLLYGTEKLHEILNDSLKISAVIARQDTPQFGLK